MRLLQRNFNDFVDENDASPNGLDCILPCGGYNVITSTILKILKDVLNMSVKQNHSPTFSEIFFLLSGIPIMS